jgi:hypothetical protein
MRSDSSEACQLLTVSINSSYNILAYRLANKNKIVVWDFVNACKLSSINLAGFLSLKSESQQSDKLAILSARDNPLLINFANGDLECSNWLSPSRRDIERHRGYRDKSYKDSSTAFTCYDGSPESSHFAY